MSKLRKKFNSQSGFAYLIEVVVVGTFVLCCCIIGLSAFSSKLVGELGDLGTAVGSLNQSFTITGSAVGHPGDARHPQDIATNAGSSFTDTQDFCDNDPNCACGVRFCIPPTPEIPHPASTPP